MRNLSLKTKLIASFAVVLLFINVLGIYALHSMSEIKLRLDDLAGACMQGLLDSQEIIDRTTKSRGFELSIVAHDVRAKIQTEEGNLNENNTELAKTVKNYIKTVKEAFYDSEEQRAEDMKYITDVDAALQRYQFYSQQVIALKKQGRVTEARTMLDGESFNAFGVFLEKRR